MWGYRGAGPAQLALAVLAHAAGDEIARAEWEQFREAFLEKLDIHQTFAFTARDITVFLNGQSADAREFIKPVRKPGLGVLWKQLWRP